MTTIDRKLYGFFYWFNSNYTNNRAIIWAGRLGLFSKIRSATAHSYKRSRLFLKVHIRLPLKHSFCHGANSARIIRFCTLRPSVLPRREIVNRVLCARLLCAYLIAIRYARGRQIRVYVLAIRPRPSIPSDLARGRGGVVRLAPSASGSHCLGPRRPMLITNRPHG